MAHHNSTPRSILDAPVSRPEVVSEQHGFTRTERRRPGIIASLSLDARREARAAGSNTPATATRERKIRKGRMARFNRSAA